MKLQEGIRLFIEPINLDLENNRLSLYEGTMLVEKYFSDQNKSNQYYPKSFIPKLPSRSLFGTEKNILCSPNLENYRMGNSLAIVNIPNHILSGFDYVKDLIIKGDTNNLALALNSEQSKLNSLRVVNYVKKFGNPTESTGALGINLPDLITVTRYGCDKDTKKRYVGLHIDNSYWQEKLERRHLSPVKICINLGLQARYLLFINLSLKDILKTLQNLGINNQIQDKGPPNIVKLFMENFPNYPVIRLTILPGEAYIAPVENMIHDGSTLGCSQHSVNLQIRGYFDNIV